MNVTHANGIGISMAYSLHTMEPVPFNLIYLENIYTIIHLRMGLNRKYRRKEVLRINVMICNVNAIIHYALAKCG